MANNVPNSTLYQVGPDLPESDGPDAWPDSVFFLPGLTQASPDARGIIDLSIEKRLKGFLWRGIWMFAASGQPAITLTDQQTGQRFFVGGPSTASPTLCYLPVFHPYRQYEIDAPLSFTLSAGGANFNCDVALLNYEPKPFIGSVNS